GLCGALPGPAFLINTDCGIHSVAAHSLLSPGWHHIAGVYDGSEIHLVIDGKVVASRTAQGRVHLGDSPITIGALENGLGFFEGTIREVRVSWVARSVEWLAASAE